MRKFVLIPKPLNVCLLVALVASYCLFSASGASASLAPLTGQQIADQYDQLWGDPDTFLSDFEDQITPMMNQYMGLGVAACGFGLVGRSLFLR